MKDSTAAITSRRAVLLGLSAVFLLTAPAFAQGLFCPRGGYHLWVLYAIDKRTGRTVQRCMKCGVFKIG